MALLTPVVVKYKGLIASVLIALLSVPLVWGNRGLMHVWRLQSELRQLEVNAARARKHNDDLRNHLRRLRLDPTHQERIVRERLGWVKEGERLLRLPRSGNRAAPRMPAGSADEHG